MRHHHELPLKGVMELHPDLTMRHHHETIMELRPDHEAPP